jgi:hypothetical protein
MSGKRKQDSLIWRLNVYLCRKIWLNNSWRNYPSNSVGFTFMFIVWRTSWIVMLCHRPGCVGFSTGLRESPLERLLFTHLYAAYTYTYKIEIVSLVDQSVHTHTRTIHTASNQSKERWISSTLHTNWKETIQVSGLLMRAVEPSLNRRVQLLPVASYGTLLRNGPTEFRDYEFRRSALQSDTTKIWGWRREIV